MCLLNRTNEKVAFKVTISLIGTKLMNYLNLFDLKKNELKATILFKGSSKNFFSKIYSSLINC